MQFINLMRNKLKVKTVAEALDANTNAVADINALIGSTPLPTGETITHLLAEGGTGGGATYSTEERKIGKWIDGKDLYQKTFLYEHNSTSITGDTAISSAIEGATEIVQYSVFWHSTDGLGGLMLNSAYWADTNDRKHIYLDPTGVVKMNGNSSNYRGKYYTTLQYTKD